MEPFFVSVFPACHGRKENPLDTLSNRSAPAAINRHAINLTNRRYFRSSAGEERFVSGEQICERHGASDNALTMIPPDADHCIASDPHQDRVALVVGYQFTIANDEEVLTGSFSQMSFAVQ